MKSRVVKYTTVRFILALATEEQLQLSQLAFNSVFFIRELKEEIYMEQPAGYCISCHPYFVYRLYPAFYGLRQASRAWDTLSSAFSKSFACVQSEADKSRFLLVFKGTRLFILIYVQKTLLSGSNIEALKEVANIICIQSDISIEKNVTKFFGIVIL